RRDAGGTPWTIAPINSRLTSMTSDTPPVTVPDLIDERDGGAARGTGIVPTGAS
ncbi:hypothetical protein GWI33_021529, partial [Rhynchophorus ferrugineus]